jgi:hypothetical protein
MVSMELHMATASWIDSAHPIGCYVSVYSLAECGVISDFLQTKILMDVHGSAVITRG